MRDPHALNEESAYTWPNKSIYTQAYSNIIPILIQYLQRVFVRFDMFWFDLETGGAAWKSVADADGAAASPLEVGDRVDQ